MSQDENNVVYTFRYMWKIKGNTSVNFKIISDVLSGVQAFEDTLLRLENLDGCAREYLHEYDVSRVGVFEKIFDSPSNLECKIEESE